MPARRTILLAQGDATFNQIYTELFSAAGYQVTVATTSAETLKHVETTKPRLIFIDMSSPEAASFELIAALRIHPNARSVPILLFAILGETNDLQRALKLGANDYIVKGRTNSEETLRKVAALMAAGSPAKSFNSAQKTDER